MNNIIFKLQHYVVRVINFFVCRFLDVKFFFLGIYYKVVHNKKTPIECYLTKPLSDRFLNTLQANSVLMELCEILGIDYKSSLALYKLSQYMKLTLSDKKDHDLIEEFVNSKTKYHNAYALLLHYKDISHNRVNVCYEGGLFMFDKWMTEQEAEQNVKPS